MDKGRRAFLLIAAGMGAAFLEGWFLVTKFVASHPGAFSSRGEEADQAILPQRKKSKAKGLPPGLAKRAGNLPPGL